MGERGELPTCIIGMHRSGTSMVARLLNLAGLDLGDVEQHLRPQTDNPLGFWENRDIMDLNDRILAIHEGSWMRPPVWRDGWEVDARMASLVGEAGRILDRAYGKRESLRWGWKDPRTTLTLPFWRRVVGSFRPVLVIRNPLDVAHSLQRRHDWSVREGIELWKAYVTAGLRHNARTPMLLTFYEDYFQEPTRETERLLQFCGLPISVDSSELLETIRGEHRHHRAEKSDLLLSSDCPDDAKFMYFGLRQVRDDVQRHGICLESAEFARSATGLCRSTEEG